MKHHVVTLVLHLTLALPECFLLPYFSYEKDIWIVATDYYICSFI